MAARSRTLYLATWGGTDASVELLLVPSGFTALVKVIHFIHGGPLAMNIGVNAAGPAGPSSGFILEQTLPAFVPVVRQYDSIVLEAGHKLIATRTTTQAVAFGVYGALVQA